MNHRYHYLNRIMSVYLLCMRVLYKCRCVNEKMVRYVQTNNIGKVRYKGINFISPNKFKINANIVDSRKRYGRISFIL